MFWIYKTSIILSDKLLKKKPVNELNHFIDLENNELSDVNTDKQL